MDSFKLSYSDLKDIDINAVNKFIEDTHIILSQTCNLLDLGCGVGTITALLCDKYPNISKINGLDNSIVQLTTAASIHCPKRSNLEFIFDDIMNLGKLKNIFDVIFSYLTFNKVTDQVKVLQGCYNNLAHNGHLLFCVIGYSNTDINIISEELIKKEPWSTLGLRSNRSYYTVDDYIVMSEKIGFKSNVKLNETKIIYKSLQEIKNTIKIISPYYKHIKDLNKQEDFLNAIIQILLENAIETKSNDNETEYILRTTKISCILFKP